MSEQRSRQSRLNKEREGDFIQFTIYYNSKSDVYVLSKKKKTITVFKPGLVLFFFNQSL
jgi:hypothetical protein